MNKHSHGRTMHQHFAFRYWPIVAAMLLSGLHSVHANELQSDVVLIGGGYDLHGSQGQIELNVKWVQEVLEAQEFNVTTYFTDGDTPGWDVHYNLPNDQQSSRHEPLARVFGDWFLEKRRYREHTVPNVKGSTQRNELEPALRDLLKSNARTDDMLLIFNGHGSQSYSTPDQVTVNLWDNTNLSANELHALLEPRKAPLKYIFTQCYSGGFHRLSYDNPVSGLNLSDSKRCGFTSESAYRLAEGCSAGIEIDDYRDYTTYFFSALSGFERNGDIIGRDPDTNKDGQTSLREAHLFTLQEGLSTDLSRSSSEDYLLQWQPWYLRWLPPTNLLVNNEYAKVFRDLAVRHSVELNGSAAKNIRSELKQLEASMQQIRHQRNTLRNDIVGLQYTLQTRLGEQWPALLGPFTGAFESMVANGELDSVIASIRKSAEYEELRTLQNQDEQTDTELLELERTATQFQKMLHLRHLAILKQQISDYGSAQEQSDYASLLNCEEEPLGGG